MRGADDAIVAEPHSTYDDADWDGDPGALPSWDRCCSRETRCSSSSSGRSRVLGNRGFDVSTHIAGYRRTSTESGQHYTDYPRTRGNDANLCWGRPPDESWLAPRAATIRDGL
ncbi:hypothetical protein CIB48_g2128 [Xylaria polymorpha]|nr:hypothetical protein CIB48_g2128 [Xylaria polymorpha]